MTLQKILYLVQAAHLVWHGTPAFSDDIQAYVYGPVVPWVEYRYRANTRGGTHIDHPVGADVTDLPATVDATIDAVLQEYGDASGTSLARLVKKPGSPWREARGELPDSEPSRAVLPLASIRDYHRMHGVFRRRRNSAEERDAIERYLAGDDEALHDLLA